MLNYRMLCKSQKWFSLYFVIMIENSTKKKEARQQSGFRYYDPYCFCSVVNVSAFFQLMLFLKKDPNVAHYVTQKDQMKQRQTQTLTASQTKQRIIFRQFFNIC